MIDHFTLSVIDLQKAVVFYEKALAPLGYSLVSAFEQYRGFGPKGKPSFWVKHAEISTTPMHIAFSASSRAAVDAFHQAALAAGARDDGQPGVRGDYHPNYYAAFVVDPLGHPIEAVCHVPSPAVKKKKKPAARPKPKPKAAKRR